MGLIADPDFPEQLGDQLVDELPKYLREDQSWTIDVEVDPVAAGRHGTREIMDAARERVRDREWEYVIVITDLPVRRKHRPVLAEADIDAKVAVVSLPALGGVQPYRRARQIVVQLLDEFTVMENRRASGRDDDQRHGLQSTLTGVLAPIHREVAQESPRKPPEELVQEKAEESDGETAQEAGEESTEKNGDVDVRYVGTRMRGRFRLLTGMVRTNRPWRLIFGMSSALAAALATSAFGLSSSTIWQISDQLATARELLSVPLAVGILVLWLIVAHHLWEKTGRDGTPDREQVLLYNTSTVLSLTIGVSCMYITLFAINLGVAYFLVPSSLLTSTLGSTAGFGSYFTLAWGFTTMGMIAGALGSSLETDQAVRQAAYGYREEQRRRMHQESQGRS